MINKFKSAFTLAEVLITLVLIGVISALTIPMFAGNFYDHANHAALKKSYAMLQNGFEMIKDIDNDNYNAWTLTNGNIKVTKNIFKKLNKYLKIMRDCGHTAGCWPEKVYTKNKTLQNDFSTTTSSTKKENYAFVLNDGTSVLFTILAKNTLVTGNAGIDESLLRNKNLVVVVDVNGLRGPNVIGKDVYYLVLTKEGLLPEGVSNNSANCDKSNSDGYDCAAKYIFDEDKK